MAAMSCRFGDKQNDNGTVTAFLVFIYLGIEMKS